MMERAKALLIVLVTVTALVGACSSGAGSNDGAAGGSGGGGGGAGGGTMCGSNTCASDQICLRTQTLGGAQLCPQDGATCPNGYDLVGSCCVPTPG